MRRVPKNKIVVGEERGRRVSGGCFSCVFDFVSLLSAPFRYIAVTDVTLVQLAFSLCRHVVLCFAAPSSFLHLPTARFDLWRARRRDGGCVFRGEGEGEGVRERGGVRRGKGVSHDVGGELEHWMYGWEVRGRIEELTVAARARLAYLKC